MMLLAALLAAPAPLPFAPPLDHPLRYRQTEHRTGADGRDLVFTLDESVTYARDGDGYLLTIRSLSAHAAPAGVPATLFEQAMAPFVGVDVRIHVSADGRPGAIVDADAVWAHVVASMRAMATALPAGEPAASRAMLARTAQAFADIPPTARDTMIREPAVALLGIALPDLPVGGSVPIAAPMELPDGPAIASTGTTRRLPDDDGARHYLSEGFTSDADAARLGATTRFVESTDTRLSISSGLLLSSSQRIAAIDPAAPGGKRTVSLRDLTLVTP